MTLKDFLIYLLENNDNLNKEIRYSFRGKNGDIIDNIQPYNINIENENITINI